MNIFIDFLSKLKDSSNSILIESIESAYKLLYESEKPEETSICAIFKSGKVLILKRGSTAPWMPNKWSLVGGGVDEGESPEDAAIREVYEETNITVSKVNFVKKEMYSFGLLYIYTAETDSEPVLNYENTDYAWIGREELDKYSFVPSVKEILVDIT